MRPVMELLKKFLLNMERLNPVRVLGEQREVLLHPTKAACWDSLHVVNLKQQRITPNDFYFAELELSYENWSAIEILKSVLPMEGKDRIFYRRVGQILHVHLKDHLLPYKNLIGQVLLDKIRDCRTVVNRIYATDNHEGDFEVEFLCGSPECEIEIKQYGFSFKFDFSKVPKSFCSWEEHGNIVKMLKLGDVLYEVSAGMGQCSVPAARKGCLVLSNESNPEIFRWLQHNAKKNNCPPRLRMFNKDARQFILEDLRENLFKLLLATNTTTYGIHIVMNLPDMAVDLLDAFRGLYKADELTDLPKNVSYPTVHIYCLIEANRTLEKAKQLVEEHFGEILNDCLLQNVIYIGNISQSRDLYRVSIKLSLNSLTTREIGVPRKRCAEEEQVVAIKRII
ncbi:tRNA (guanine(37)-N1)-methyltransferase-like [Drosophila takahashii]|uniref:tRNA (guanine(37)-N1)-methyltransferase-like n=1 Tax=Drosophila takahashii TaxID=29030 RepID=UPI001CF91EBF|nr:tRNA (guanine(37)-N1)-methyltransferase-like [Drosophila takahashii]